MLRIMMAPVCWLMGIPWAEAATAGALMGLKTVLNEFVAYLKLAALPADALSERSRLIMVYAMWGIANFGSLGIMIGGLATMGAGAPRRRGLARVQIDRIRDTVDVPDRRRRRSPDITAGGSGA
jgi:concentrative nucleoside transporter, CNT family